MTDLLADWWQHEVQIARRTGAGAFGDTYADAAAATGFVDDSRKLVRTSTGEETTSSATVFLPVTVDDVPLGSKVTLPAIFGGRTSTVIAVARHDAGTQPVPSHVELNLL